MPTEPLQATGHAKCPHCGEEKAITFLGESTQKFKEGTPTKKRFNCGKCSKAFLTESSVRVPLNEGMG